MKTSTIPLAIVIVSLLGFLMLLTFFTERSQLQISAEEMHERVLTTDYVIEGDYLINGELVNDPSGYTLIDIREAPDFDLDHRADAVNIPLALLLDQRFQDILRRQHPKIILAHDGIRAHEAWMLLTQMGYEDLYVLE